MEADRAPKGSPTFDHHLGGREAQKYLDFFHSRVIGQKRAIELQVSMLLRYDIGFASKKGPAGIAAFFGPSGVGKTYLAKVLAEWLFGDETALTLVGGQEYYDKYAVSRLIGSPPGYVGYFNKSDKQYSGTPPTFSQDVLCRNTLRGMRRGLSFAEQELAALEKIKTSIDASASEDLERRLRTRAERLKARLEQFRTMNDPADIPSIVLIDEVEKMHPDVRQVLLTAFNEGSIPLPNNDTTSFRNTFFILTGNIAEKEITKLGSGGKIGFEHASEKSRREKNNDIWKVLKPELLKILGAPLLGRIGQKRIVSFDVLGIGAQLKIFDLPLEELQQKLQLHKKPCRLEVDDAVKRYLVENIEVVLGARSLDDLIEAWIERPLIALLVKDEAEGGIVAGDVMRAILVDKDGAADGAKEVRFVCVSRSEK